jgi:hypothetical protein
MYRAVFLSCSQRKVATERPVPAIERYDGPCFRALRKHLRANPPGEIQIWIVSAEHGLISGRTLVPLYDRRMTAERAKELQEPIRETLAAVQHGPKVVEAFACLSSFYALAMERGWSLLGSNAIRFARGSIGGQVSQLVQWLGGSPSQRTDTYVTRSGGSTLCGVTVTLSAAEITDSARRWLVTDRDRAARFQTWYVPVDEHRVAPKWLVSHLTGLPVSRFRTADARRFLGQLGIEVYFDGNSAD